jgi:hypothetical protein
VSNNFLRIEDLVTFRLTDENLVRVQDDYEGAFKPPAQGQQHQSGLGTADGTQQMSQGLQVRIAATHSGIITRNNGFYLPDKMKKGASTFTDNYPKPLLLHHEDQKDPIGRIIAANYLDTSGAIEDKYHLAEGLVVKDRVGKEKGIITDVLLRDFVKGNMPFGMQVDVVCTLLRDSLLGDSTFEGLGHIQIIGNITDKVAIEKLLDGRYLTGSVGATTNKAICSVCRQDWTKEGQCEHKPGALYDGAKCFVIAGDIVYDEYSFVNVPADRHSKVLQLHFNGIQDSIPIANEYSGRIYEVHLGFPQYDSVAKEENGMKTKEGTLTNGVPQVDIQDSATPNPGTPESTDQQTGTPEGEVQDEQMSQETPVKDEAAVKDAETDSGEESLEDFVTRILDVDELSAEDEEKLYDLLWTEAEAGFQDGDFTLEELGVEKLEDAKLSTAQRKRLAKSTFCGPERSFPVPDCAHVTAARRLIGRYKGPGSKSAILACVARKAKALGCGDSKKNDSKSPQKAEDALHHGRVMHMVVAALEEAQHFGSEAVLDNDEVKMLQGILKRLATFVGKDNFVNAMVAENLAFAPECEQTLVDEIVKGEETIGSLRDALDALRKEYTSLYADVDRLQDSLQESVSENRKSNEAIYILLTGLRDKTAEPEVDFSKLSDSELASEVGRVTEEVDMTKIVDKLGDGMAQDPTETVDDPTAIQDNGNQKSVTTAELGWLEQNFMKLLFSKGQVVADTFRQQTLSKWESEGKKLPQDGEN